MRMNRSGLATKPAMLAALIALALVPAGGQAQTAAVPTPVAAANGVGSAFELTFWQSVIGSEDAASYEAYLARYPDGTFSGLARARIAALQRAAAAQPAAAAPAVAAQPAAAPTATPAVLTVPQSAPPLAPTSAVAVMAPAPAAPAAAEMIPAAATAAPAQVAAPLPAQAAAQPAAYAEAAPTPLARLLAQLRGSGEAAAQPAPAPLVTPVQPVQPLPAAAPGLATSAPAPAPAPAPAAYAPAAAAVVSPAASYTSARPLLVPVPEVPLPAYFCSNDARNAFHNNTYRPAVEIATRNNEAAVAYLRQLQQTYDRGQLGRDTAVLNAIAAEARAYQAEAARAYTVQAALVRQFDALMSVPLRTCVASIQ